MGTGAEFHPAALEMWEMAVTYMHRRPGGGGAAGGVGGNREASLAVGLGCDVVKTGQILWAGRRRHRRPLKLATE